MFPLEAEADKFDNSLIHFSRPVSRTEAIDFLWGHTTNFAYALRPDLKEFTVNGKHRNFIIKSDAPDVLLSLHHGLNSRRMRPRDLAQGTSWVNLDAPEGHVASIYFATNESSLDDQDRQVLAEVYNYYRKVLELRQVQLLFVGYADYRGTEKHNKHLGTLRAEAVAKYFSPLTSSHNYSWGASSAGAVPRVGSESTSKELSPYRRVDIKASPARKLKPDLKVTEPQTTQVTIKFIDCDPKGDTKERLTKERQAILDAHRSAIDRLDRTLAALNDPATNKLMANLLQQTFKIDYKKDVDKLNKIRENYNKVRTALSTGQVTFHCYQKSGIFVCRKGVSAMALGTIRMCLEFFDEPPDTQAETIVHEALHRWVLGGGHPEDDPIRNPFNYTWCLLP